MEESWIYNGFSEPTQVRSLCSYLSFNVNEIYFKYAPYYYQKNISVSREHYIIGNAWLFDILTVKGSPKG